MELLKRLFGKKSEKDVMQLDILMDYTLKTGQGVAAVKWDDPFGGGESIKAQLVSLLYGRILCVHKETRHELYSRVGEISKLNVRTEGAAGFQFDQWILDVDGDENHIWPWQISDYDSIIKAHRYTTILKHGDRNSLNPLGRWIHLNMAFGLERVLCPASIMLAVNDFSTNCSQEARYFLALLLWQMNEYWGSADDIAVNTEARANAAAEKAIRSGVKE